MKKIVLTVVLAMAAMTLFAEQYTATGTMKYSDKKDGYYYFSNDEWWFKVFPENAPGMDLAELPQGEVTITFEADELYTHKNGKQRPKDITGWKLLKVEE
jgi:hypothetical protein